MLNLCSYVSRSEKPDRAPEILHLRPAHAVCKKAVASGQPGLRAMMLN